MSEKMNQFAERIAGALIESPTMDGLVGLSMESNRCFGMNLTASRIWALIETPQSTDQIVNALCAEFEVSRDQASAAVDATLAHLEREGLVRLG